MYIKIASQPFATNERSKNAKRNALSFFSGLIGGLVAKCLSPFLIIIMLIDFLVVENELRIASHPSIVPNCAIPSCVVSLIEPKEYYNIIPNHELTTNSCYWVHRLPGIGCCITRTLSSIQRGWKAKQGRCRVSFFSPSFLPLVDACGSQMYSYNTLFFC